MNHPISALLALISEWMKPHCNTPRDMLENRLAERVGDVSDATKHPINSLKKQFEPFDGDQQEPVMSLATQDQPAVETVPSESGD